MSSSIQKRLEEELAKIDPAVLRYFDELLDESPPAVRKVVGNVLDEPISQETQACLQKTLVPNSYEPRAPPRQRRQREVQALLREYNPFPAWRIRTATDYQREILDLYDDKEKEGEEETTGRRFIRWRLIRRLGRNLTPVFMAKIRERVSTSFYLRHVFGYQLRNIEDNSNRVLFKPQGLTVV